MRIGIDARMYGPDATTGIGAYIKEVVDRLFVIDDHNEYVLFMKEPAFSTFQPPNERVIKVLADISWYSIKEQFAFPPLLLKHNLDLVHFPHFNAAIWYPKKFVVTIHDITPKFFPGPKVQKSLIRKLGYQFVFKQANKKAAGIITVSNHTKENIIKYFDIPENKIKLTPLGVRSDLSPVTDDQVINSFKQKNKITKPVVLYVGVWRDHKNLPTLIAAFNEVKKQGLDVQLVISGKPDPAYPEIMQAIKDSPYKNDIITPGFVDDADMATLYSLASVSVLPSFCEGFGLVTLESMMCGTPVIGSNSTSLPEVLGDAAKYFDPKNSSELAGQITEVINNQELRQQLIDLGYQQVKKYSWNTTAKQTLQIYESV